MHCYALSVLRIVARLVAGVMLAAPLVCIEAPAVAQDDWSITRQPRSPATTRPRARRPGARRGTPRAARPPAEASAAREGERTEALIERYMRVLESDPRETFAFQRLLDLYRERDGNIDRLVQELDARVAADAAAYAPRMLLGHLYRAQSQLDEARAAYRRAAELRPRESAPLIALAQVEESAGQPAEARRLFDQALALTHERLAREELLRDAARLAMETRDFEAARGYYRELGRGGQGSVFLRSELARALGAAGEWAQAVAEYEQVIRSLRGDNRVLPPVLLELSRAQLESGDAEPSIETLDRALRIAGRQAGIRAEIYDQMLIAYRRSDRLPELAERLRREAGQGFEASALLGRIEDELGNDEEALAAYRRALRARGNDIDTRVRIIQILTRSGRLRDVAEEYRALIRSAPREPRFVIELAQLLMQTDQREDALRLVRDAGRRNARDAALHQQLAELYSRWGEDELASREIELLARIDPRDPSHIIALGAQQFAAGDRDAAMATWRRLVAGEGDRAEGHATLAAILADHDLLPQAIEEYREAVRLDGDELSHVRGLATALERNRDTDAAETEWRRVLELAGEDRAARREARERIVGIWTRTRQITTRVRELEQRFAADPPDAEAGRFLAEAHRRGGAARQDDAERVLERVIEIEPGDVDSLLALERLRSRRGDLAGAIVVLERLRDADPRRAAQHLQRMAEHALALYRDEDAVRYAAEAVRRNPDDASGHRRLGELYRARQDTERAAASYRRALELNERLYPVYFELAELHLARGDIREADRLYRQVLRITPDDDLVSRAARASTQINLGAGTLGELERDLLPLALGHPQRPIFRRMVVELYDAYVGPLRAVARRGGEGAPEASAELRQIGTRAIKPLLEALADQDPAQRRVALDILGDLGNPNAAAPLLALAENESLDLGQRLSALLAAGAIATPALGPRLMTLAESGDRRLRGVATWGIARVGGRDAPRSLRRLLGSSEPAVRAFAAIGLGVHGAPSDASELARAMASETHEDARVAMAFAVGRRGDAEHVPALVRVLEASGGGSGAAIAADALGAIGGERAIEALITALFEPDARLRAAAASALRRGDREQEQLLAPEGFEGARDYLVRVLHSRSSAAPVRDLAALAPALEAAASQALGGPVEQVLAALTVLASAPVGVGLGPLTEGMAGWPDEERASAERALSALSAGLGDELVGAAEHLDAAVRVEAVQLLVRLRDPDADAAIAAALAEPPAAVQRAALDALAASERTPSAGVAERLAITLRAHRDWSMRTRAARALARAESEPARGALREALRSDAYAFVREAAATALGQGLRGSDVSALESAAASDGEPRVRLAATAGLLAAGGEVAERARARAAADPNELVRSAAER